MRLIYNGDATSYRIVDLRFLEVRFECIPKDFLLRHTINSDHARGKDAPGIPLSWPQNAHSPLRAPATAAPPARRACS
jgi:hypothetical protein